MLITEDNVFTHRQDPYCMHMRTEWGIFRLANWQGGLTCSRWARGNWVHVAADPGLIVLHEESTAHRGPIRDFIRRIPMEVQHVARRFRHLQLTVLRFLRCAPASADLACDVPALFWLLCRVASEDDRKLSVLARTASKKRREIVRLIFGEQTMLTPQLFRKIRLIRCDYEEFLRMWEMLYAESQNDRILHWPSFAPDTVGRAYRNGQPILPYKIIVRCISEGIDAVRMDRLVAIHRDTWKMFCALRGEADAKLFAKIAQAWKTPDDLMRHHDKLAQVAIERSEEEHSVPLPVPPLFGTPDITPITDSAELFREGRDMAHCVYSQLEQVLRGELSIYKVLRPERATLAISRGSPPQIVECSLRGNEEPSFATMESVRDWLKLSASASTGVYS